MIDLFNESDDPAIILLQQLDTVKDGIIELEAQLEEVERTLSEPKVDVATARKMINSAMITIAQIKMGCL